MPLYHRLYVILRGQITNAIYRKGDILPSEQVLMQRFGVSRITAKRALDELSAEGLVVRSRGRGTVVSAAQRSVGDAPITARLDDLLENITSIGRDSEPLVLEFGYGPANEMVCQRLQLAPGAEVQRAVRLRQVDGTQISQLTSYVPDRIGRSFACEDLKTNPLITLIRRAGVRVCSAEQSVTAVLADSLVAERLGVSAGSPLLLLKRVLCDAVSQPVEYLEALYRPDRFEFRMHLSLDAFGIGASARGDAKGRARPVAGGTDLIRPGSGQRTTEPSIDYQDGDRQDGDRQQATTKPEPTKRANGNSAGEHR